MHAIHRVILAGPLLAAGLCLIQAPATTRAAVPQRTRSAVVKKKSSVVSKKYRRAVPNTRRPAELRLGHHVAIATASRMAKLRGVSRLADETLALLDGRPVLGVVESQLRFATRTRGPQVATALADELADLADGIALEPWSRITQADGEYLLKVHDALGPLHAELQRLAGREAPPARSRETRSLGNTVAIRRLVVAAAGSSLKPISIDQVSARVHSAAMLEIFVGGPARTDLQLDALGRALTRSFEGSGQGFLLHHAGRAYFSPPG